MTNKNSSHSIFRKLRAVLLGGAFCVSFSSLVLSSLPVHAEPLTGDGHPYDAAAEQERSLEEVQSNLVPDWPEGPTVTAKSAILMDVDTGTILYSKNIHEKLYPASTTKMLTCLIAAEHLDLNDTVTFSYSAVHDVPADGSNVGMDAGETITVEECLYGILVGSANECASAIAEKVAGSVDAFTDLMNERAAALGCTESHFVNANGLYDDDHYTSAYDLCLIGRAFFANETLSQVGNTAQYHFVATDTQPDDFWITNKHKLINGEYSYSGILGGKTGYTSQSKETLVTGCEQNGTRLVCVVMMEDDPKQFDDTVTLFDYGYSNFTRQNIAENDVSYNLGMANYLQYGIDLYGNSTSSLYLSPDSYANLPNNTDFSDLWTSIDENNSITYYFGDSDHSVSVGNASLFLSLPDSTTQIVEEEKTGLFSNETFRLLIENIKALYVVDGFGDVIYINIISVLVTAIVILLFIIIMTIVSSIHRRRTLARRYALKRKKRRGRRRTDYYDDYYDQHRYDRYNNDDWNSY